MKTRVRLSGEGLSHGFMGLKKNYKGAGRFDEFRDAVIVCGPPEKPTSNWACGTDLMWPVLAVEGRPDLQNIDGEHALCRHQILAGD